MRNVKDLGNIARDRNSKLHSSAVGDTTAQEGAEDRASYRIWSR